MPRARPRVKPQPKRKGGLPPKKKQSLAAQVKQLEENQAASRKQHMLQAVTQTQIAKQTKNLAFYAKIETLFWFALIGAVALFVYQTYSFVKTTFAKFIAFLETVGPLKASPFQIALGVKYPILASLFFVNKSTPTTLFIAWSTPALNKIVMENPKANMKLLETKSELGGATTEGDLSAAETICQVLDADADLCKVHCTPSSINSSVSSIAVNGLMAGSGVGLAAMMVSGPLGLLAAAAGAGLSIFSGIQKRQQEQKSCEAKKKTCINSAIVDCQ